VIAVDLSRLSPHGLFPSPTIVHTSSDSCVRSNGSAARSFAQTREPLKVIHRSCSDFGTPLNFDPSRPHPDSDAGTPFFGFWNPTILVIHRTLEPPPNNRIN